MNNKVTVIVNGQQSIGDIVTYFQINQTGEKYLYYTKNEPIDGGLVKLYVEKEANPNALSNGIEGDWKSLSLIMQNIIYGKNLSDITYLAPVNTFNSSSEKKIALKQANIDTFNSSYNKGLSINNTVIGVSNADMLNQSFTSSTQQPIQSDMPGAVNSIGFQNPAVEIPLTSTNSDAGLNVSPSIPVITPISSQSNVVGPKFDMENTPVSMNPLPSVEPLTQAPSIDNSINSPSFEGPLIDTPMNSINSSGAQLTPMNTLNVESNPLVGPTAPNISPVNTSANMFDTVPTMNVGITQNEINNESIQNSIVNTDSLINDENKNYNKTDSLENDMIRARVSLNNEEISLYEKKIVMLKNENKLLQSKISNKSNDNNVLENTASELFNNNGSLNDNKVLEIVPDFKIAA